MDSFVCFFTIDLDSLQVSIDIYESEFVKLLWKGFGNTVVDWTEKSD